MALLARFVEAIEPNPVVRMDVNDGVTWKLQASSRLDPPPAKRVRVSTSLVDGATYPATTYDDRLLVLRWVLIAASSDAATLQVQQLARELNRAEGNILQYQPNGATHPVFFRTRRLGMEGITYLPTSNQLQVDAQVPAEPFAYGLPEYLRPPLNTNPGFEITVSPWTAAGAGLALPGASGDYASTPDAAVLDITGDIDLRVEATLESWENGASQTLVAKYLRAGDQRSYNLQIGPTGLVQLVWSTAGTLASAMTVVSTVDVNLNPFDRVAIRATLDVDNGSAQNVVTFYTAPTIAGPWTQLGAAVTTAGATSIFAGTALLTVGADEDGASLPALGTIHAAEVRSGIAGTVVANPDFAAQTAAAASFVDGAGLTWTINGDAEIVQPAVARSTDEAYEGIASLELTPGGGATSGAVSEEVAATAAARYVGAVWVHSPGGYSAVRVAVDWLDSGSSLLSTSDGLAFTAPAGVWTRVHAMFIAPASTATMRLRVEQIGTPDATDVLHVDDAQLRDGLVFSSDPASDGNCIDLDGIKGDVPAPMLLQEYGLSLFGTSAVLTVRSRGDVTQIPYLLQCEAMTQNTDTTTQANDVDYSGSGNNFSRCTFATVATMERRLRQLYWPIVPSVDARGTYRVFLRVKRSSATGVINVRLRAGPDGSGTAPEVATVATPLTTQFRMLDFGLVSIPAGSDPVTHGPSGRQIAARGIAVDVDVERASGTSTIDLDYLVFVPADEQLVIVDAGTDAIGHGYTIDSWQDMLYAWMLAEGVEAIDHTNDLVPLGELPRLHPAPAVNRLCMVRAVLTSQQNVVSATFRCDGVYWPQYLLTRSVAS